ncbi:4317_t:CDS:1, partial [Dentiscutata heterogama]
CVLMLTSVIRLSSSFRYPEGSVIEGVIEGNISGGRLNLDK